MLEECDKYKPMVDPKVGHKVDAEHFSKTTSHRPSNNPCKPKKNANIGDDDLIILVRRKERLGGVKVYIAYYTTC